MTINPHHPHDSLFRRNFARKDILGEFLDHVLPPELIEQIDKDSLEIETTSYIDEDHKNNFSDVSASVTVAGCKARVYILVEHKSYNDPWALLQVSKYMNLIWQRDLEEKRGRDKTLTSIIPIIFHQGKAKNPRYKFSQLFQKDLPDVLKPYQPEFLAALYNLTTLPKEKLHGSLALESTLSALKYVRHDLDQFFGILDSLIAKYGKDVARDINVQSVWVYIYNIKGIDSGDKIQQYLKKIDSPEVKESFMNLAQHYILQGKEEGLMEGLEKGLEKARQEKIEMVINMRKEGAELAFISKVSGLSLEELKKILK